MTSKTMPLDPRLVAVAIANAFRNGMELLHGGSRTFLNDATCHMNRLLSRLLWLELRDMDRSEISHWLIANLRDQEACTKFVEHLWRRGVEDSGIARYAQFHPADRNRALKAASLNLLHLEAYFALAMQVRNELEPLLPEHTFHPLNIWGVTAFYAIVPSDWNNPEIDNVSPFFEPGTLPDTKPPPWALEGADPHVIAAAYA